MMAETFKLVAGFDSGDTSGREDLPLGGGGENDGNNHITWDTEEAAQAAALAKGLIGDMQSLLTPAAAVSSGREADAAAFNAQALNDFGTNVGSILSSLLESNAGTTSANNTRRLLRLRQLRGHGDGSGMVQDRELTEISTNPAEAVPSLMLGLSDIILEGAVAHETARKITTRAIGLSASRMTAGNAGGVTVASATPTLASPRGHKPGSFQLPRTLMGGVVQEQLNTAAGGFDIDVVVTSYAFSPHPMVASATSTDAANADNSSILPIPWSTRGVQSLDLRLPQNRSKIVELQNLAVGNLLVVHIPLPIDTTNASTSGLAEQAGREVEQWGWGANTGPDGNTAVLKAPTMATVLDYCNFSLCIKRLAPHITGQSAAAACGKTAVDATTAWKATSDVSWGAAHANSTTATNTGGGKRRCPDLCTFYDENERGWARKGCEAVAYHLAPSAVTASPTWSIECHCTHATSFSTALDGVASRFEKRGDVLGNLQLSTLMVLVFALSGGFVVLFIISVVGGKRSEARQLRSSYNRYAQLGVRLLSGHESGYARIPSTALKKKKTTKKPKTKDFEDNEEIPWVFVPRHLDSVAANAPTEPPNHAAAESGAGKTEDEALPSDVLAAQNSRTKSVEMVDVVTPEGKDDGDAHGGELTSDRSERARALTRDRTGPRHKTRRKSVLPPGLSFVIRKHVDADQRASSGGGFGADVTEEKDARGAMATLGEDEESAGGEEGEGKDSPVQQTRGRLEFNLEETEEVDVDDVLQSSDAYDSTGRRMMRARHSTGGSAGSRMSAYSSSSASTPPSRAAVEPVNENESPLKSCNVDNPMRIRIPPPGAGADDKSQVGRVNARGTCSEITRNRLSPSVGGSSGVVTDSTPTDLGGPGFGFLFWRNLWEFHYVLRMFARTQDKWFTRTQRVAVVFASVFCKMLVLSLLYDLKIFMKGNAVLDTVWDTSSSWTTTLTSAAQLSNSSSNTTGGTSTATPPSTVNTGIIAYQGLAVLITVLTSTLLTRPIHMMHRYEKNLRRKRALLLLRDALLDPGMMMMAPEYGSDDFAFAEDEYRQQRAKRVVVSNILLHDLRVDEALNEWRQQSSLCGGAEEEEEGEEEDQSKTASTFRGDRATIKNRVKAPTPGRVLRTQLLVWFVTLTFAAVSAFEVVYFFAYEESKESFEVEKTIVGDVGPFSYTNMTVQADAEVRSGETLTIWLRMLGESLLIWVRFHRSTLSADGVIMRCCNVLSQMCALTRSTHPFFSFSPLHASLFFANRYSQVLISQPCYILVRHAMVPFLLRTRGGRSLHRFVRRCCCCSCIRRRCCRRKDGRSKLKTLVLADLRLVRLSWQDGSRGRTAVQRADRSNPLAGTSMSSLGKRSGSEVC